VTRRLLDVLMVVILGFAGLAGFRLIQKGVEAEVYRERLAAVASDYEELRGRFNEAVRRTAVTELVVENGALSVAIRNAAGEVQRFETPYDPAREIYVDYVVLDGRLWIRRVFDGETPPEHGMLIDPGLAEIDWNADPEGHGKAAYRSLEEGRWVVSVTGDGSLGLTRIEGEARPNLVPPPPVRDYDPVETEVGDVLRDAGPVETAHALVVQLGLTNKPTR
jgi:hypothetical protein